MNMFAFPWLECALVLPLLGAAILCRVRDVGLVSRWCLVFAGMTLGCTLLACSSFYNGHSLRTASWQTFLHIDELNALLLPLVALLHLLTALATARTKMPRFSFAGLLFGMALRLTALACIDPWLIVAFLTLDILLPIIEIRRRGQTGRLYILHTAVFVAILTAGVVYLQNAEPTVGSVLVLSAVLVRTGMFPTHVWYTDLLESSTFGTSLMLVTPLIGVYAAVRLALPSAPEWSLEVFGIIALVTAAYTAGRGIVEQEARRFFAYLVVSHAALVLAGLGLHTPFAVTGALVMWLSTALSLTGLGLTLRALEARVGSLALTDFRGLYQRSPGLAVCFLMTGLATVGFPGTSGFIAIELLVDEALGAHLAFGLVVVLTSALNGIGVVRVYLILFTGRRSSTGVSLGITRRERVAVITLIGLILSGGLFPQVYLESRQRAASTILRDRPAKTEHTTVPSKPHE
jgi:NADH-quinone oxidoreductase subunit M